MSERKLGAALGDQTWWKGEEIEFRGEPSGRYWYKLGEFSFVMPGELGDQILRDHELREYAEHKLGCPAQPGWEHPAVCVCGLAELEAGNE